MGGNLNVKLLDGLFGGRGGGKDDDDDDVVDATASEVEGTWFLMESKYSCDSLAPTYSATLLTGSWPICFFNPCNVFL